VYAVQTLFNQGVIPVVVSVATLPGLSVLLVSLDRWLTFVAFTIMPLHVLVTAYYARRIRERSTTLYQTQGHVSTLAERCLWSIRLIQAFACEAIESPRFAEACRASFCANLRLSLTQLQSALVIGAIAAVGTAVRRTILGGPRIHRYAL
jgi:ABC-type multidrug transport system fused ATPase/permease subunit